MCQIKNQFHPPSTIMNKIPTVVGLTISTCIASYLLFPTYTASGLKKVSGTAIPTPDKFTDRIKLVTSQINSPTPAVQFYRNITLFGGAVYLIATQGHQMTVA